MDNSFVMKGNVCQTLDPKELDLHARAFVVCVDGVSKGVFDVLPEEYASLPLYDYGDMLILPGISLLYFIHVQGLLFGMTASSLLAVLLLIVFSQKKKRGGHHK